MPSIDKPKALAEFDEGRSLGSQARSLYAKWGFSDRPFQQDLVYSTEELFIDSQVYPFLKWVGSFLPKDKTQNNSHANEQAALFIGPDGIGKTTIVRKVVRELGKDIHAKYKRVPNQINNFESKPDEDELHIGDLHIGFESPIEALFAAIQRIDLTDTRILFLDDADVLCKDFSRLLSVIADTIDASPHITILIVSPATQQWLWNNAPKAFDLHIRDTRKLSGLSKDEIISMLQRRIDHFSERTDPPQFTKDALERIADYSMGLPGLALDLADSCLDYEGIKTITGDNVYGKAKERNFDIAKRIAEGDQEYWEGSRGEILRELTISLSPVEQQQLKEERDARTKEKMLDQEGTRSAELLERISLSSQGTTSYHLKKLIESGIVRSTKMGRNQLYTILPPIRNAIELSLMS